MTKDAFQTPPTVSPEALLPSRLDPLVETAKTYARAATSAHTNRAYAADWRDYLSWRARRGLEARSLADPETVGLYLAALASGEGSRVGKRSAATIERRLSARTASRPLVEELHAYLRAQLVKLSRGHDLVKAINYMLKRWPAFTLFLDDGRVYLSNNAAERALRGVALGRKSGCSAAPIAEGSAPPRRTASSSRRR